jgi:hypothetical protein
VSEMTSARMGSTLLQLPVVVSGLCDTGNLISAER